MPRVVRPLEQAVEFQRLLDSGQVRFRADLARRTGLSAMRVSQVLALLRLPETILSFIRSLPPGTPPRILTERFLRRVVNHDEATQFLAMQSIPGFDLFTRQKAVS
jgi:hypothetical protein